MKAIFENHKIPYQFQDNLRIEFSLIFMTFSASIFASICSSIFDGKCHQNDSKKHPGNPSKSILFATMSESRFLDAFWSPFGSLWVPFWLPLVPFGLPLAHFWLPLAHFWLTLAHFWFTLPPFWLTFATLWLILAVSWSHLLYFYVFSMKMSCKIVF